MGRTVKEHAQMMKYLTRPRDVFPDPSSEDQRPRNMKLAKANDIPDAFNPDLEQSEILKPGETLEDWKPNPFLKPHAEGGRILNAVQVGEDRGDRTGFRKPKKITDYPLEIQKRIKEFGIKKYNKLKTNQQKHKVRNPRTSTKTHIVNYGNKKINLYVKNLRAGSTLDNIQELLNIINKEELTPENWFGKTSRKQGKKGGASAGVDVLARDLVRYLKGEEKEIKSMNQIIFDQLNIKDLIGEDKTNILSKIDGMSFRQTKGQQAAAKSAVEGSFDAVKLINKEFMLDPDVTLDELAEQIYGKGASNSVRAMKDTQLDILKYLDVLKTGTRRNIKMPDDFKFPSTAKIFEILDSIESRTGTFGFQEGAVRDLKFNIRDNLLNFKKGSTMNLRRVLSEIISESDLAKQVIDESVGLSATYDTMPGYTEATQMLPDELNKYKAFKVDKPFNELLKKIGAGTATPKEIKDYNKVARAFIKETGADAPIIRSSILNDDLKNVRKYIKNFDDFSLPAQKDIIDVAKKNKIIIETKSSPLTLNKGKTATESAQSFFEKNQKFNTNTPEGRLNMKKLNTSVAFQKFLKDNGIVVPGCGRQKVVTGGRITFSNGTCGGFKNADEFAKGDPENFLNTVQADPKASKVINNADASVMKNVFKWAAKDIKRPTGWIGGDLAISTIFTAGNLEQGLTPLEAVDQGLLWFVPNEWLKKVGLGDAYKKALTKGMSEGEANYIKKALDLEMADKNYFTNKDELDNFNKALKDNKVGGMYGLSIEQIKTNINRLEKNMEDSMNYASQIFEDLASRQGTTLPGTKTSDKNYRDAYTAAQDNLFEAKKQKAVTGSNISKKYDLGREYQKYLNDLIMPDILEKGFYRPNKNYQDYDIFGDKSGVFTDYFPSPTRPLAPVTATIGRLAGNYAQTNLPFADNLKDYLEKIASSRGKGHLLEETTMDNLTQGDFDRLNQFESGIKRDYKAGGGISTLRSNYEYKK